MKASSIAPASQPELHTQVAALVAAEDVVVPDGAEGIGVRRDGKGVAVEREEHVVTLPMAKAKGLLASGPPASELFPGCPPELLGAKAPRYVEHPR